MQRMRKNATLLKYAKNSPQLRDKITIYIN